MTVRTQEELDQLRRIGSIVARCLRRMAALMEPGMTTAELDAVGEAFLDRHGARSAPRITYDFPGTTCISVNEAVAHGIPGEHVIQPGDLVNIDVSAELNGYFADTGASYIVPPGSETHRRLCDATRRALRAGMNAARAGKRLSRIGRAIEKEARKSGYGIVENLCSHGVGRSLHDEPGLIPSYEDPSDRRRLALGQVITIEPFLTTGPPLVTEADDGWTMMSAPGTYAAQYEHTMVITKGRPMVMTQP